MSDNRFRRLNNRGFTLIETVIFGSMSAVIALAVVPYLNKPAAVQKMVYFDDAQRKLLRAMNVIENDLSEASPASIDFSSILPVGANLGSLTFSKVDYDFSNPGTSTTHTIQYMFQLDGSGVTGTLTRTLDGGAPQLILDHLMSPTTSMPIFQGDPVVTNILITSLKYQVSNLAPISAVRRLSIKG